MNFLNDLIKIRTIFFILLFCSLSGKPVFPNDFLTHFPLTGVSFNLPPNALHNPVHDITFSDNGLIYISTFNELHIGNGVLWESLNITGTPHLIKDKNNVYYFTNNNAGKIIMNSSGSFTFTSLSHIFNRNSISLSSITGMAVLRDIIYLINEGTLFVIKDSTIIVGNTDFKAGKLFKTNKDIIIFKPDAGFTKYGINQNIEDSVTFLTFQPDFLLEYAKGYITYSKNENKFLKLNSDLKLIGEWIPGIREQLLFADQSNDYLFFYSVNHSLWIFSTSNIKNPVFSSIINLQNVDLKSITVDRNKIWFVQNENLSFVEYPPVFLSSSFQGIYGTIISTSIYKENIFLGTDKGLYVINPDDKIPRLLISGFCKKIIYTQNGLVAQTEKGLFSFPETTPVKLLPGFTRDVVYDSDNDQIIISLPDKLLSLKMPFNISNVQVERFPNEINPEILHIYESNVFYNTKNEIFKIRLADNSSVFSSLNQDEIVIKIFTYRNETYLLTDKNCYLINNDLSLVKITLSGLPADHSFFNAFIFHENSLWLILRDRSGKFKLYNNLEPFTFTQIEHPLFNNYSPFSVSSDVLNRYLISSGNTCFLYNPANVPVNDLISTYNILISKIISGKNLLFEGINYMPEMTEVTNKLDNIPYNDNSLVLNISTTNYSKAETFYRYSLSGKNDYLSEWTSLPLIELKNLKKGKYILKINSVDSFRNTSEEKIISFNILTPYYLKWWAKLFYFLILFIIGFILYKHFRIKDIQTVTISQNTPVSELVTKETSRSDLFSDSLKPSPSDKSKWEKYDIATVLFSDIQGFTKIAEQMNPETLIDELDTFFFHFDSVCEKYNIEKIKTIGDAYMAAGGIPKQNSTNPIEVVLAALEMQHYMKQLKNSRTDIWDLRIGIHSGPIIGGIIGHKKRSYDIWGDTVNTASRMESSGEPEKVNISGTTYNLVKDFFVCEYRGKLPVKYKGNIDMYFVNGLRPELSVNLGTIPNRIFFLKLQLLHLKDLEEYIFENIKNDLPANLYFHSFEYIQHVYSHAELLIKAENIDIEDKIIIKTSVLLLFTGLTKSYQNFENKSAEYARQILPEYKFSDKQINIISNLILFGKLQHDPQNHYEKIIYDLITEHFGRADYLKSYKMHYLEIKENKGDITIQEWKKQQINFLRHHDFYTLTSKRLREVPPEIQIQNIESDDWQ